MAIAKVEPLVTTRALRGPFDYRLPARLAGVEVGSVLLVPFGRRRVAGVVVELAERSSLDPARLVEPVGALEAGASAELVRLGLWVAREYCSTPARGLELVLPPGTSRAGAQTSARRETIASLTRAGRAALAPEPAAERIGPVGRRALELLAAAPGEERGAAELAAAGVGRDSLRRLSRRGLVELRERELRRRPRAAAVGAPDRRVELDHAQRAAVTRIEAGLDGAGGELLLHGVTGSGKTEVYLAATAAALERGRGAIVLVPEIGLTPQTVSRFHSRFGDSVAVIHSRLAPGERRDEWQRLRRGEARICVGPRSAAFAPVAHLGLVVVDEEHDSSYKQEADPRYDARLVAAHRARESRAVLVCGTATPRPESWAALERLELASRVDGRPLPAVEVLDMRAGPGGGPSGPLHERTREALAGLRAGGGKAIVLVNRRGWAPHLACRSCGEARRCEGCDVSLVLHRAERRLRCHHCGHGEPVPSSCPACGSVAIARVGAGSERVESLIAELVDPLPAFRLDSDTAARPGAHLDLLERFQAAPAGVLVGTQMVAKGHDFPDVVLAVVLDADATLRFPDFRAEERTFALVSQLAGRSGRGERGGRVLVQTAAPEAEAIVRAASHDAAGFLAGELARRRELSYPPYSQLIRIELASADIARLDAAAAAVRGRLESGLPPGARALGPAPRFRLRGRERRQIVIKAPRRGEAVPAVREAVESAARERLLRDVNLAVDVDPQ